MRFAVVALATATVAVGLLATGCGSSGSSTTRLANSGLPNTGSSNTGVPNDGSSNTGFPNAGTTTQRLGAAPVISFDAPHTVHVRVGEPTKVAVTITNQSRRAHALTLQGHGTDGVTVAVAPTNVALTSHQSARIDVTLTAERPAPSATITLLALTGPATGWQQRFTVIAS